ncbi:hypothetical protein AGMMS49928_15620 [Spirochaetia bacterium]|nr:hypothetical protein AGMMS49928_15620 [Spirochaetia bacterium]
MFYYQQLKYFFYCIFIISVGIPIFELIPVCIYVRNIILVVITLFVLIDQLIYKKNGVNVSIFTLFILSYFISLIAGYFILPELLSVNWNGIKIILVYFFIFFFGGIDDKLFLRVKKVIIFVALLNVIWAILQFIYYTVFDIPINDILFLFLVKENIRGFTVFTGSTDTLLKYRLTGLSWDPYYLGVFCIMLVCLTKSKIIKLMAFFALFFSYSRMGYLGVSFYLGFKIYQSFNKLKEKKSVKYFYLILIPFIIIIVSYIILFLRGRNIASQRIGYYIAPFEILSQNLIGFLWGGSPVYGGIVINLYEDIAGKYGVSAHPGPWLIESDVINTLLGRGVLGFLVYIFLFFTICLQKNIAENDKLLCLSLFIAGIGYFGISSPLSLFYIGSLLSSRASGYSSLLRSS